MFDLSNAGARPSFYEMEWRARHERRAVINALMCAAARSFATWLCVLVRAGRRNMRGLVSHVRGGPNRPNLGIGSQRSYSPIKRSQPYRTSVI
jgi:hypothetical protein